MQARGKFLADQAGFTLIEVLIAVAILVFGLMAYGVFSGNIVNKNAKSKNRTLGATLAQDKIEEFKDTVHRGTALATATGTENVDDDGAVAAGPGTPPPFPGL